MKIYRLYAAHQLNAIPYYVLKNDMPFRFIFASYDASCNEDSGPVWKKIDSIEGYVPINGPYLPKSPDNALIKMLCRVYS
jgi:hypothetical protein